ncbi:putative competence-damage inducible protein [compost metagenome]
MNAEILCVGTELLIGQTVNTNATYLAQELAALGISLYWVTTVGDNPARLDAAIRQAASRADLVLVTGGLGPTADDITTEAIAQVMGEPLVERPEERDRITAYFERVRRFATASNYKMALFPPSAELIPNATGTASGMAVTLDRATFMTFPGVPFEMKAMWETWARPRLAAQGGGTIRSALLKYAGIGEAQLAEQVASWLEGSNPSVAPYAAAGEVHLRVTAMADTAQAADAMLAPVVAELQAIRPYYFGRDDETLPSVVGQLLLEAGATLAVAESCTGGLLASRVTDVAGASRYFKGGVVAYLPEIKSGMLGLPEDILGNGAVNQAVAEQLAEAARRVLGADWGLGVTGFASAGPGVPDSDVGLIWGAVAGPDGVVAESFRYGARMPRETLKHRATQAVLDLARRRLSGLS